MTVKVAVLCWDESRPWVSQLRQSGFSVPWVDEPRGEVNRQFSAAEPDLLLVDLTRQPEQGVSTVEAMADEGVLHGVSVVLVGSGGTPVGLADKVEHLTTAAPADMIPAVEAALAARQEA